MTRPRYVIYTAVLPAYRRYFVEHLLSELGPDVRLYAGAEHSNATVRTSLPAGTYTAVRNIHLLQRRVLLQWGSWRDVIGARSAILDLNPRSVTAWILLVTRRLLRRRTLLWGHMHPRGGEGSKTAGLRRAMRRLGDGAMTYSYKEAAQLTDEDAWVAPNSLFFRDALGVCGDGVRTDVIYVGRLELDKSPGLLVEAFARIAGAIPDVRLVFVGEGSQREVLEGAARDKGIGDRVAFVGSEHDPVALRERYARAICAVSPGYVGLALTQAYGFGVPIVVAAGESHAPEIEVAEELPTGVIYFKAGDDADLARALADVVDTDFGGDRRSWVELIATRYSAEAMAGSAAAALKGERA